jgi:hypothetical protein
MLFVYILKNVTSIGIIKQKMKMAGDKIVEELSLVFH